MAHFILSVQDMLNAIRMGRIVLSNGETLMWGLTNVTNPVNVLVAAQKRSGRQLIVAGDHRVSFPVMWRVSKAAWAFLGRHHDLMAVQLRGDGTVWGKWYDDGRWINFTADHETAPLIRFVMRNTPGRKWINHVMRFGHRPWDFNWQAAA